jgi:LCP family protein required for cell wall assembly
VGPTDAEPPDRGRSGALPPLPPQLDPRGRSGRHRGAGQRAAGTRSRWRLGLSAVKVTAALLSAFLLLGFGYGWWSYRQLNGNLVRLNVINPAAPGHPAHDIDGQDQNILIAGNDDRTNMTDAEVRALKVGRDGGSLATDTMMIVHVPANGSSATLISLPRDSYVQIPGYGMNKLNAAYALGYSNASGSEDAKSAAGAQLLIRVVQSLTGLTIDHFVQVSLIGFVRISDAIGGVTVNLCHAVNDAEYSHFVESAGKHSLKGVTALEFVRQRHGLPNGDIDRVARQRYFLTAAFRKIASAGTLLNPGTLSSLIKAVDKSLYVDANFNMLKFAQQISGLNANNIQGQTIPFVRFDDNTPVGSVEIVDPAQVQQFVRTLIGQNTLGSVTAAAPGTVTVQVLNGGTQNGAAAHNADVLKQYGFHASSSTAPAQTTATTIRYAAGMESAAKALAAHLPSTVVLQKTNVSVLTLVLGSDGVNVTPPPSTASTPAPTSSSAAPAPAPAQKPIDAGCIN